MTTQEKMINLRNKANNAKSIKSRLYYFDKIIKLENEIKQYN